MKISAQVRAKPASKDKDGKDVPAKAALGPVTVDYEIPAALGDLVKKFGEDVVTKAAVEAIVISLQAFVRRHLEKGTKPEAIQAEVNGWKPDSRSVVKQSSFEKVTNTLDKLSAEERKALLAKLQAMR